MNILVLNSGSSSQKVSLYEIGDALPENPPVPVWEGRIEWNGNTAAITVRNSRGITREEKLDSRSSELVLKDLLGTLWSGEMRSIASAADIDAVGHRVVHGGPHFHDPVRITSDVHAAIGGLSHFAPLHIQSELEGINVVADLLGDVPQFAVFDTGFHHHMLAVAQTYPGPYEWFENGIRRYGFHGISHQYCATRSSADSKGPEVTQNCKLSSREWLLSHRHSRGPQPGYHHGIHAVRRTYDGYSLGFS
jgi:acetate kinase